MADASSRPIAQGMPGSSKLFEQLNFLIVVTRPEHLEAAKRTVDLLRAHSCQICSIFKSYDHEVVGDNVKAWFVDEVAEGNLIHFIISEESTFPFYHVAAFDFLIPVVKSEWIHECISTKRHVRTFPFSPDPRHIFKDFQIYVSRHSFNSSEYLFYTEAVHALGGTCVDFLSNRTTHLVTKDCQDPGILAVLNFGKVESMKFVYPTWVMQSLKQFSVASAEEHRIIPQDSMESAKCKLDELWGLVNDINFTASSNILANHSFIISMDVALSRDLYSTFIGFLESNGGTVYRHLDEKDIAKAQADCYIGKSVSSKEYEVAHRASLHLGNVIWIFYMWSLREFVPPTTKLIFAPFKRKLFETSQLITTYTNFFGQQRFYIQRLVNSIGGFTTSELSRKNTHLLCRFPLGKKYETARKWKDKCIITNHLWLEDCYRLAERLDPLKPRFQEFPVQGGLKKTLGQMPWRNTFDSESSKFQKEEIFGQIDEVEDDHQNSLSASHIDEKREESSHDSLEPFSQKSTTSNNAKQEPHFSNQNNAMFPGSIDVESASRSGTIQQQKEIEVVKEIIHENVDQNKATPNVNNLKSAPGQDVGNLQSPLNTGLLQAHPTTNQTQRENLIVSKENETEKNQQETHPPLNQRSETEGHFNPLETHLSQKHIAGDHDESVFSRRQQITTVSHEDNQGSEGSSTQNSQQPLETNFKISQAGEAISKPSGQSRDGKPGIEEQYEDSNYLRQDSLETENEQKHQWSKNVGDISQMEPDGQLRDAGTKARPSTAPSKSPASFLDDASKISALGREHNISSTPGKEHLSKQIPEENESKSQTLPTSLSPTSLENAYSSQSSRRAAKEKAARKLHEDIESLNAFQRNSKRKRTGNLLPEELALLEKRKELELSAKQILAKVLSDEHHIVQDDAAHEKSPTHTQHSSRKRLPYHINAVYTGGRSDIGELDLVILRLIGITIHNEITNENFLKLNTIIAPKKLRTAKFLKSLAFHPLRNALTPAFLKDILKIIHRGKRADLLLDLSRYLIPGMEQEKLFKLTSLPAKVFERAGISRVNIANDIPGGIEVISSIIKAHGVKETKAISVAHMNKMSLQELLANHCASESQEEGPVEYLFLVTKASQVKSFKKLTKGLNKPVLAVDWDWFVTSIFQLEVNFTESKHVIYSTT